MWETPTSSAKGAVKGIARLRVSRVGRFFAHVAHFALQQHGSLDTFDRLSFRPGSKLREPEADVEAKVLSFFFKE